LQVSVEILVGNQPALAKLVAKTAKVATVKTAKLVKKIDIEGVVDIASSDGGTTTQTIAAGTPEPKPAAKTNINSVYATLFTDPERTINVCEEARSEEDMSQDQLQTADLGGQTQDVPRSKINYNEQKKLGKGPSAYMFDHLDDILESDLTTEFSRIWGEATSDPDNKGIEGHEDPYTLDKILGYNRGTGEVPAEADLIAKMKTFNPKFNDAVWKISIPFTRLEKIAKEWNWYLDLSKPNPAKYLLDKYDYNGDGRLSPREFMIAAIKNNKKILEMTGTRACKNCLSEIIGKKIDPLYMYIDCANTNMITAEQIWKNFRSLKRKAPTKYDMYSCKLSSGHYRTTAVNDFVLKAQKSVEGKLTKEEFRIGLLTGYWDRHTSDSLVFLNDGSNGKDSHRWKNGSIDIICMNISCAIKPNPQLCATETK
jgi:hypothetical protein